MPGYDQDWTAARCQRLLRPLVSKLALLAREDCDRQRCTAVPQSNRSPSLQEHQQTKRRIRRKYSARSSKAQINERALRERGVPNQCARDGKANLHEPGIIVLPTPAICRQVPQKPDAVEAPVLSSPRKAKPKTQCKGDNQLCKTKDTKKRIHDVQYFEPTNHKLSIAYGIEHSFEAILRVTRDQVRRSSKPYRSLLSNCLRAIPKYIELQQDLTLTNADESGDSIASARDMSMEVFEELELHGTSHGWRHLQTVTRAQAVHLICQAIRRGLVKGMLIENLVYRCLRLGSEDAAEMLISASLDTTHVFLLPTDSFTVPDNSNHSRAINLLGRYEPLTNHSFHCMHILDMVVSGKLHVTWLATKALEHVWHRAVRGLHLNHNSEEVRFLKHTLKCLYMATSEPLVQELSTDLAEAAKNTFSSILVTLTALSYLSDQEGVAGVKICTSSTEIIAFLAHGIATSGNLDHLNENRTILLVARYLSRSKDALLRNFDAVFPSCSIEAAISGAKGLSIDVSLVTRFVAAVSHCCGRGTHNTGFDYLQRIHAQLDSAGLASSKPMTQFINQVILDSAFLFAKESKFVLRHQEYAHRLSMTMQCQQTLMTPLNSHKSARKRPGFRWEEGLSEWVIVTPNSRTAMEEAASGIDSITYAKGTNQGKHILLDSVLRGTKRSSSNFLEDDASPSRGRKRRRPHLKRDFYDSGDELTECPDDTRSIITLHVDSSSLCVLDSQPTDTTVYDISEDELCS